jgi:hypothetical protein
MAMEGDVSPVTFIVILSLGAVSVKLYHSVFCTALPPQVLSAVAQTLFWLAKGVLLLSVVEVKPGWQGLSFGSERFVLMSKLNGAPATVFRTPIRYVPGVSPLTSVFPVTHGPF